jgi:hypothetical protein
MREESPNSRANRRLDSGEWRCVLTSALGRKATKRKASADIALFIGEGEREEVVSVSHVGHRTLVSCWTGGTSRSVRSPILGH